MVNVTLLRNNIVAVAQKQLKIIEIDIKTFQSNFTRGLLQSELYVNEYINALFVTFEKEFGNDEFSWDEIQAGLFDSIMPILAQAAHGGGDDLDYSLYPNAASGIRLQSAGPTLSREASPSTRLHR